LGDELRAAGVPVTGEQLGRFVRAIALSSPATNTELYWLARVTLVRNPEHFDAFDVVFDRAFRGIVDLADSRGDDNAPTVEHGRSDRPRPPRGAVDNNRGPGAGESDGGPELPVADEGTGGDEEEPAEFALATRTERLASTDFAELTEEELRELYELMRGIRVGIPLRPARRRRRHRHGDQLDLRATLRRSRSHGGDPVEHVTRRARQRPRRLVVLCDISGSMAPYSRACVQLLHAAVGATRAEVFTFATRLTRVTRALAVADPDEAMAGASSTAPDWKGGTRIGPSLKTFLDDYGRRGMARGAVVVVVSDGWDRGDPVELGEQMARLARLAHRIVWINPRSAAEGFEPLAGGMAAALPYCDQLVSGHTLVSLGRSMAGLATDD
jgi:uncharacterized protein with von Willebrand factor type A (vWA) domain